VTSPMMTGPALFAPAVRELDGFHDQPAQMPTGAGKDGALRLEFERRGERTSLVRLYRRVPLLVQQALYHDEQLPGMACVQLITTTGCVLQGDRYDLRFLLGPSTQTHITTQAATKIHEMDANYAAQSQLITLQEGAYLEYLPDEVIAHKHSRFVSATHIVVGAGASMVYAETLVGGRKYYGDGEMFEFDLYSSRISAARAEGTNGEGGPLFSEKMVIEPSKRSVRAIGIMGPYEVFANVIVLTPREHIATLLSCAPLGLDVGNGCAAGASVLPNNAGLVLKVVGMNAAAVRAVVRAFVSNVRIQVCGVGLPADPLWRTQP